MEKRFNIRVYGIWILGEKVLVNEELIRAQPVIKFPGGGLHWGEGTIDCLKREWMEELGIAIQVVSHFYTTDFFQLSAFDDSQVVSIYYLVTAAAPVVIVNNVPGERTFWMNVKDIAPEVFSLPIDKTVGSMLQRLFTDRGRLLEGSL